MLPPRLHALAASFACLALFGYVVSPASSWPAQARSIVNPTADGRDLTAQTFAAELAHSGALRGVNTASYVRRFTARARQLRTERAGQQASGGTITANNWMISPVGSQSNLGDLPVNAVLSPSGEQLLVVNSGAGMQSVQVVKTSDGSVLQSIPYAAPHSAFIGVTYSPNGRNAYVSGGGENVVHTFSVKSDGTLVSTGDIAEPTVTAPFSTSSYPAGLSVSPDGKTLYVANSNANNVAIIDTASQKIVATVPVGSSPYTTLVNPANGLVYVSNWGDGTLSAIDPGSRTVVATIPVGSHPTAMASGPYGLLFVSDSNSDAISAVDTGASREVGRYPVLGNVMAPLSSSPQGLAVSRDGRYLYVANAGDNAVAVFAIGANGAAEYFQGWIPTAWYPTDVVISSDGFKLYVTNGFGMGEHPNNGALDPNPTRVAPTSPPAPITQPNYCSCTLDQFSGSMDIGTLSTIRIPDLRTLGSYSLMVAQNDHFFDMSPLDRNAGNPVPVPGGASPIKHVIYIIKENRTYDQVLGDEPAGNGDPSLTLFGKANTPNLHALAERFGIVDNFYADAQVSADGHNWALSANASDYDEKFWPQDYSPPPGRNFGYPFEGGSSVPQSPGGYLWDAAARAGLTYRDYGLYALFATPGKVVPESQGCSGPSTHTYVGTTVPAGSILCFAPTQVNPTTSPNLVGHIDPLFQNYDMRYPDADRVAEWKREFNQFESSGTLPQLEIVRLSSDHTSGTSPGLMTPQALVADNDAAVGQLVDTVSHSKDWASTAIFVTEDDAQNGPDHVDSHRTIALVISPYTSQAAPRADHTHYDTAAMVRTIELILGMKPLSKFDATAAPMWRLFSGTPDTTPYTAAPLAVPPASNPTQAYGAAESARMNFALPDHMPMDEMNRILWHAIKGARVPYPRSPGASAVRSVPSSYAWGGMEQRALSAHHLVDLTLPARHTH